MQVYCLHVYSVTVKIIEEYLQELLDMSPCSSSWSFLCTVFMVFVDHYEWCLFLSLHCLTEKQGHWTKACLENNLGDMIKYLLPSDDSEAHTLS